MHKVWVTGAEGQLGGTLCRLLYDHQTDLLTTDLDVDVSDLSQVMDYADSTHPNAIINCAAITDVNFCEEQKERAFQVNALGPRNLAIAARKIGVKLIHISTDDVFDGKQGTNPWTEFDLPSPVTVYGKSKLAGENFVRELTPKHTIIRSCWTYGRGNYFIREILKRAQTGESIYVPSDQIGSPTSALDLSRLILYLMNSSEYGLYHGVCEGKCSRMEFAEEILRLSGKEGRLIPLTAAQESPAPAQFVLDNFMLRLTGTYRMPDWKTSLREYMKKFWQKGGRN
ncbi:MAG: dTDP-4-dehydrorhamnose reductase [Clostridiales bacterium]|nr:dTDP-4-dehydrorhamnose reductase [Clostridiales bacterium]